MDSQQIKNVIEAALLGAGMPLSVAQLKDVFGGDDEAPSTKEIRDAVAALEAEYEGRGITVIEVASGFRIQIRSSMAQWLDRLWEARPPRYSRALLETLAIIAYRQPITRGDIEEVRGVSVSTNIMRTLMERGWVRVVGHRDVPGKPALFATTKEFLDYFSLKKLDELPPLADLEELEKVNLQLELEGVERKVVNADGTEVAAEGDTEEGLSQEGEISSDASAETDIAAEAIVDEDSEAEIEEAVYEEDTAPGMPQPLVKAVQEEGLSEPATVASLDEARAAAADNEPEGESGADAKDDANAASSATVVPIKST
ncbi:MAG: SMC-Scp complex subunit ScpB [Gammaproteobacteria bacterium]